MAIGYQQTDATINASYDKIMTKFSFLSASKTDPLHSKINNSLNGVKYCCLGAFAMCLALIPDSSIAFGQTGHRITGAIAEIHLSEHSKRILKRFIGNKTLAEVSYYADEMRSNPSDFWQNTAGPYHYVTVPKGKTYKEVGAPKQGDAFYALEKFSSMVRNTEVDIEQRKMALKFIVHIIGDLHQPLHAGNGEDRGGNQFEVKFFGRDTNLHTVWDNDLIKGQNLSYSEWSNWLNAEITKDDIDRWNDTNPLKWIEESVAIRDTIYPKSKSIRYTYVYENRPIVAKRLKQAGIRMALYLDELLNNID